MEGKRGSECLLKSVSNIDFNPVEGIQIIGENHCYLTVAYHGWSGEKPKTTLNMIYEIEWD